MECKYCNNAKARLLEGWDKEIAVCDELWCKLKYYWVI